MYTAIANQCLWFLLKFLLKIKTEIGEEIVYKNNCADCGMFFF